jgi:lipopolysaccharide biosynthesis glycosyltransferase
MEIDVALCFRDDNGRFFINAYVTLLSVLKNTKEKIIAHILHDETLERGEGRHHLQKLCDAYGHEIQFHHVHNQFDADTTAALSQIKSRHIGMTYRYYVQDFVKAEKAVYLDCDVIVNRDLAELYTLPLGDRLFAAVLDTPNPYWKNGKFVRKYKKLIDHLGFKLENYINSGVLLMNLDKLRELSGSANIFVQKTQAAVNNGTVPPFPDQDIINSVAAGVPDGVLLMDTRFNLWHKSLNLGLPDLRDTIFHYMTKPDKVFFPAHLLWWKYYAMSPFAGDMFERMDAAYGSMEFVRQYAMHPGRRRHAADLLRYGSAGMLLRAVGRKLGLAKNRSAN